MYKNFLFPQTDGMRKIKIFDGEGKSRDERETCFPSVQKNGGIGGAGTR